MIRHYYPVLFYFKHYDCFMLVDRYYPDINRLSNEDFT